jgi:hypothetical protein
MRCVHALVSRGRVFSSIVLMHAYCIASLADYYTHSKGIAGMTDATNFCCGSGIVGPKNYAADCSATGGELLCLCCHYACHLLL